MEEKVQNSTRSAYLWSRILNTPFWAIFNILPFIMYKDLHATLFQLWAIVSIKPFVSLFSMYWGDHIHKRRNLLRSNIILGNVISHLPFLFIPFIQNPWYLIFSSGIYMMFARGISPAWMEVLKLNLPRGRREKVFAYASAFGYVGGGVLPFFMGWYMDSYEMAWRWIFPVTAIISLLGVFFQMRLHIPEGGNEGEVSISLSDRITRPWKKVWSLLYSRPDFTKYQFGFMLGGGGLIIMQPALQIFFVDRLALSYTEMTVALTLCKGIGFGLTIPAWSQWINQVDIYRFLSAVTFLCFLFPFGLILSEEHMAWLYFSYFAYGVMQAGSELGWNMSGPIFAKDEDSSVFTSMNLVTAGIRGCFFPMFGALLCSVTSPSNVMIGGGVLGLFATLWLSFFSYTVPETTNATSTEA